MPPGHDLDHDPAVLDALDRFVAGVDPQLLADLFLDRDLSALTYSAYHGTNVSREYVCVKAATLRA